MRQLCKLTYIDTILIHLSIYHTMTSSAEPLIIHSIGTYYSKGVCDELSLLTSGEFTNEARDGTPLNSYSKLSRWSSPHITKWPTFFRLGAPPDIKTLGTRYTSIILALDARVLLNHAFQLNVGWYPNARVSQTDKDRVDKRIARNVLNGIPNSDLDLKIKVSDFLYPERAVVDTGAVVDGRTISEAELFLNLKKLDKSRRYVHGLNGPGKSSTKNWMMSNEILVDGPVPFIDALRVVFIPDVLPPTYAKKIRAVVSEKYPHARVKEYKTG